MLRRIVAAAVLIAMSLSVARFAGGQTTKPLATKGQGQLAGGNGKFGVTYTLKNGWNFTLYSAKYTLDPFDCYGVVTPGTDEKLLNFTISFKNATPADTAINQDGMYTFVDETGKLYSTSDFMLDGQPEKGFEGALRPGQGVGVPGSGPALHGAVKLPSKARIVKIMINYGRKFGPADEKVFRYYIAGATKAEAGAAGDPKNAIAPLPAYAADPADPSGSTALAEGKGVVGTYFPSKFFNVKLNSATTTTDKLLTEDPGDGMKFVVLNATAKYLIVEDGINIGYVAGGDFPTWYVMDGDGERYKPWKILKNSSDEEADHQYTSGDEYTFRVVFKVPKAAVFKKVVAGAGDGRAYAFDGSIVK